MQKFAMLNVYFREQHSHSSRYVSFCMAHYKIIYAVQISFVKINRSLWFHLMIYDSFIWIKSGFYLNYLLVR